MQQDAILPRHLALPERPQGILRSPRSHNNKGLEV